jgi:hypothetical protein
MEFPVSSFGSGNSSPVFFNGTDAREDARFTECLLNLAAALSAEEE